MQFVFATRGLDFDGSSLSHGSLGGSETALICVARELAKLGHLVRVFANCSRPGVYDGVHYSHVQEYKKQCATLDIDVLIASRWADFLVAKSQAGLRVLWCHDILVQPDDVMPGLFQTDMLMLLSDFHIEQYTSVIPELKKHIWKTSNGVDLDLIAKSKRPKVKKKLIYTSRPERGLHFLLGDILPQILEKHPDAKLHCCTYQNNLIHKNDPAAHLVEVSERLAAEYPNNVVSMGGLKKEQLYAHISSSQLWLFPTAFPEIFCIGSSEAQACGTPVVSTNDFALREVVGPKSGILLDGRPPDKDYIDRFAETVISLLDDQDRIAEMSSAGPEWIQQNGYDWASVAKSWVSEFESRLQSRWDSKKQKVLLELERRSDLIPAKRLAEQEGLSDDVARISQELEQLSNKPAEDVSTVAARYQAAIPRFRTLSHLVRYFGKKPKKILDWRTGDIAFGLVAAKEFPDSEITVYAQDPDVRGRLEASIAKSNLTNIKVVEKLSAADGFDLVFADEQIDASVSPSNALKSLMAYVNTGGFLGFSSRYGAMAGKLADASPDRLWNLGQCDFQKMFGEGEFKLAFSSEGCGRGGDLVGHWLGVIRKTSNLQDPDLEGRKFRTRPYQSLAVCMITKNEEDWILGCLKSVAPIADKIVMADSKSTDGTQDIARAFGAEVREIDFDNFGQARMASIENAGTDWIMWLDADERVVGLDSIRKYLQSEICEGFGIRQNHLMLDMESSFDVPIRIFKNKPEFRFNGYIHEQPECVSEKPFDVPIAPALILPDVDVAHYGYINERVRRQKVSNRNLQLLIRDVQDNKDRAFTWVFVMRDYLNFVKWYKELGRPVDQGSFAHICLNNAVATYLAKFANCENARLRELAEPMYQEALKWLGMAGLCYADLTTPPFEIGFTLTGAVGGLEDDNLTPKRRWFVDASEFRLYLDGKGAELQSLLLAENGKGFEKADFIYAPPTELPDPTDILRYGCNLFASRSA